MFKVLLSLIITVAIACGSKANVDETFSHLNFFHFGKQSLFVKNDTTELNEPSSFNKISFKLTTTSSNTSRVESRIFSVFLSHPFGCVIDAFIDKNIILNYHRKYFNKYQLQLIYPHHHFW